MLDFPLHNCADCVVLEENLWWSVPFEALHVGTYHIIVNFDVYDTILDNVPSISVISIASFCRKGLGVLWHRVDEFSQKHPVFPCVCSDYEKDLV
jgi:hypothetical protein